MDANLQHIKNALSVTIKRRGHRFEIDGEGADLAKTTIEHLFAKADKSLDINDIRRHLADQVIKAQTPAYASPKIVKASVLPTANSNRPNGANRQFEARTASQKVLIEKIATHTVTLCSGPAGTGKTHVAIAAALQLMQRTPSCRLFLSRPVVEAAGERLGFLPGDMEKKVNPYLRPLYDTLAQTIGTRELERKMAEGIIEVLPLAFMRGITLKNTLLILDEAQNTTPKQMIMLLSRIGDGSKIVVCGDPTQNDIPHDVPCGLSDALERLGHIPDIATHQFSTKDIVRHPLVHKILAAYEK